MQPLIYGYIRVDRACPDDEIRDQECALRAFADAQGYRFAALFHEQDNGAHRAFFDLVRELARADAHHVVMSSTDDLSPHSLLRGSLLACLEKAANAQVHTLAVR